MKRRKKNWKKVIGFVLVAAALWILLPMYFLPTDLEFYALFLIPWIGIWAFVLPFLLAFIMLPAGLWMMGLPLNGKGVKRAIRKVFKKRK